LGSSRHFRIAPFDERAAVEFAARRAERKAQSGKSPAPTHAKAKFDDQIVAIAAVEGATLIYSDDSDIKTLVDKRFEVKGIAELPLPPENPEPPLLSLMNEPSDSTPKDSSSEGES